MTFGEFYYNSKIEILKTEFDKIQKEINNNKIDITTLNKIKHLAIDIEEYIYLRDIAKLK